MRLVLSTEITNQAAQALYESADRRRNVDFCTYPLAL